MLKALRNGPIEPMLAKDPIEPTEKAEPVDPTDRIEFREAIESTESWNRMLHTDRP